VLTRAALCVTSSFMKPQINFVKVILCCSRSVWWNKYFLSLIYSNFFWRQGKYDLS